MRKMQMTKWMVPVLALMLVLTLGVGCKRGGKELQTSTDSGAGTTGPGSGLGDGLPGVDQDSLYFTPGDPRYLSPVYFDFDSFALRSDALATLSRNAENLKNAPHLMVQIAGHCDERGTSEYNLALGEKRALAVREHLIRLGVSGDRLVTISYGEEQPADPGHGESAWAKNRRAEFNQARAL